MIINQYYQLVLLTIGFFILLLCILLYMCKFLMNSKNELNFRYVSNCLTDCQLSESFTPKNKQRILTLHEEKTSTDFITSPTFNTLNGSPLLPSSSSISTELLQLKNSFSSIPSLIFPSNQYLLSLNNTFGYQSKNLPLTLANFLCNNYTSFSLLSPFLSQSEVQNY